MRQLIVAIALVFSMGITAQTNPCSGLKIANNGDEASLVSPNLDGILFVKSTAKGKTQYMMSVDYPAKTADNNAKGFRLKTTTGKLLERKDLKFDILEDEGGGYIYQAFVVLTDAELKLLATTPIVEITMHNFTKRITDGSKLSGYLKCMVSN